MGLGSVRTRSWFASGCVRLSSRATSLPGLEYLRYGCPRSSALAAYPLREALRLLECEGLVESEVNPRIRVTALSVKDLEQLYAMRMQLEALAASASPFLVSEKRI